MGFLELREVVIHILVLLNFLNLNFHMQSQPTLDLTKLGEHGAVSKVFFETNLFEYLSDMKFKN
jgi:hypothetical protein